MKSVWDGYSELRSQRSKRGAMKMDDAQRLRIYRPDGEGAFEEVSAGRLAGAGEIVAPLNFAVRVVESDSVTNGESEQTVPADQQFDAQTDEPGILSQAGHLLRRFMLFTGYCATACWLTGCTALQPLHGIPVRQLPPELRGVSRANMETIDLIRLGQTPRGHFVDTGDLLGVYIYGILGKIDETPPVYVPQAGDGNPTIGLPIPVRDDGTISLPQIPALYVRGMTVRQVEEAVRREYVSRQIREDASDILVSLQKSRSYKVTVLRQESGNTPITGLAGGGIQLGVTKKGTGQVVNLPAGENDVLRALTMSGGLPGIDVQNALYVLRRPRLARPVPPAVRLSRNSRQGSIVKNNPPIVLTSGAARSGSRYEFAPGSDNSGRGAATQFGYSSPAASSALPWTSQRPVQLEGRQDSTAPWNQTANQVDRANADTNGVGYSVPQSGIAPNTRHVTDSTPGQFAEQLPLPLPSADGSPTTDRPYDTGSPQFDETERPSIVANGNTYVPPELQPYMVSGAQVLRIPIRLRPGEQAYFTENDIMLFDGDIIFIESRETEIFYTGGLLGGGQYSLPQTYDLDILEAISIANGRTPSSAASGTGAHVGGIASTNQDISVSASRVIVIRRLPDNRRVNIKIDLNKALRDENENLLVQPGDHIILRYTPLEAVAAFVERNLLAGSLIGLASQTQGLGASK